MFLRIYHGEYYKDISLTNCRDFSIGSGEKDDFRVKDTDLLDHHIRIINSDGVYHAVCNGMVYSNNTAIQRTTLESSQVFILSKKYKISMLVIEEYSQQFIAINLEENPVLSIGRNTNNNIIFDSPIVSGEHARIIRKETDYYIQDRRSMNGTYLNTKSIKESVFNHGDEIAIGDFKLIRRDSQILLYGSAEKIKVNKVSGNEKTDNRVLFKRSPRLRLEVPTGDIEIQAPPALGSKPELDKLSMFMPIMVSISLAIVMVIVFKNPMMAIYTLPIQAVSGFISFRNYKKQTNQYDEKEGVRLKKYTDHLEHITREIEEKRQEQLAALVQSDPDTNECFNIVNKAERRLWERRPSDSDFMNIRVGSGEIDFSMNIKIPKTSLSLEEDDLKARPQEIYDKYNRVSNAPITCSFLEYPICGIVGSPEGTAKLINNMLVQAATHHCYTELKIVSVYDKLKADDFDWIKYLPHSHSGETDQLFISKTKMEAEACFKAFDELFKKRKISATEDNSYGRKLIPLPYYLFVISAPNYLSKNHPMTDYLFRSKNLGLGIGVIFSVEDIAQLPPECELIIELNQQSGQLYNKNTSSSKQKFILDSTSEIAFENFGRKLKSIYCEDVNTKNTVPTKFSFYEMLGIKDADELNLEHRWKTSDIKNQVAAPLGIHSQNELLYLDLHETAHGPHGLVAGKTGSGKSEVLLSYLVSMATLYHPYEVQFVIIDFKGGGMSDRLEKLPHLNASITNIDGNANGTIDEKVIKRSLVSINAEIIKRQKVLSETSAKDIYDYIEKYKKGLVSEPLPHLIIVVDEFAELKATQPEFMKNLVSASRIGRSLGVHLILATQSPAGVVDDEIWRNSDFKLSLMVLDESSSNAVLKSPLAAHITNPGRGYLKVGNGELFELFQSGYSGVKVKDQSGKSVTQLDAVIEHISRYFVENHIKKLPSICLPALPHKLIYKDNKTEGNNLTIGLLDDPQEQYQGDCGIDIFGDNTIIIGSAKTGKTNLLQTVIRTLASNHAPNEVSIYIIDFSTKFLKNYETLNHVGGVVTSSEDEKLKNLFKLLNKEMEKRKEKQLSVGVSSFASYKEAGYTDIPQIVVIIDNLTALKELYFQDDDMLLNLCSEGATYGITFVIGNSQTSGIGYKYFSHFGNRIAFYCNDSSEYLSLFEHCRERLDDIPGRALVEKGKRLYECQTYLAFEDEKEHERAKHIREFIHTIQAKFDQIRAVPIPSVPDVIKASDVEELMKAKKNNRFSVLIGVDYTTVEPYVIDLNSIGIFAISGRGASGKTNFVKYLVNTLDKIYTNQSDVYIIDGISRKLSDISGKSNVKSYEILAEKAKEVIVHIEEELEERYAQVAAGKNDVITESNLIVLVINSVDILDELCADVAITNSLRNIISKYKNLHVAVIIGNYENKNIPYGANEVVKKIKEDKHIFFFDNIANLKVFDVPLAVVRQFKKPIELGDCYYMRDNEYLKIKTILSW